MTANDTVTCNTVQLGLGGGTLFQAANRSHIQSMMYMIETPEGKTVFIDARKMGTMKDRIHRELTDEDIQKIGDTVAAFQNGTLENVAGFCAVADLQEIAKQDYILTPGRYVGVEEQEDDGEPFEEKMARLTGELSELFAQSHALEEEIRQKLGAIGYGI